MMEQDLHCIICFDMFKEPVTLPCNHSYCRDCLKLYAEHSTACNPITSSSKATSDFIECPQCRAPANLGGSDIMALPVNSELAELLKKCDIDPVDSTQLCTMCDDNAAAHYCETCSVFYCDSCLETMHPLKGPLKRHRLRVVENDNISRPAAVEDDVKLIPQGGDDSAACEVHSQPYTIFCVTCQTVICTACLSGHNGHNMGDIPAAAKTLKAKILRKLKQCEQLQKEVAVSTTELSDAEDAIEKHEEMKNSNIMKTFNEVTSALQSWKFRCLSSESTKHEEWRGQCSLGKNGLERVKEDLSRITNSSRDLLVSPDVILLQDQKQVIKSLQEELPAIRAATPEKAEVSKKLLSALEGDPIIPMELVITEVSGLCESVGEAGGAYVPPNQTCGATCGTCDWQRVGRVTGNKVPENQAESSEFYSGRGRGRGRGRGKKRNKSTNLQNHKPQTTSYNDVYRREISSSRVLYL